MAGILKVDQYQDFNGNNIMTSDGSGNLTLNNAALKNTPSFLAYKTSNQTISNDTFTKITFDAEQLDSDTKYDTSNSRFTPTVAGYYFIGAIWRYDTATDFDNGRFVLYRNGSSIIQTSIVNNQANGTTFSAIIYSDADDYFEMYGRQNSGGNVTINGGSTYLSDSTQAQFFGYKLIGV